MTLTFTIEKEDHLIYQLFQASQSERIKKKRRRAWLIVPVTYLIIGVLLYFISDMAYLITFASVAALWFGLYPTYSRWQYKNHYAKYIEENFKKTFGKEINVTLEEDTLFLKDKASEGRIRFTEFEFIYEIGSHFFLRLNSGSAVILPKERLQEANLAAFIARLEEKTGLKRETLDWKWS